MATGGVTVGNMSAFFDSGAFAVGMGDTLFGDFNDLAGVASRISSVVSIVSAWNG